MPTHCGACWRALADRGQLAATQALKGLDCVPPRRAREAPAGASQPPPVASLHLKLSIAIHHRSASPPSLEHSFSRCVETHPMMSLFPVNQPLLWSLQIDCTWCMSSSPVNCMGVPIQLTGDSCQDCLRLDIESTGDAVRFGKR